MNSCDSCRPFFQRCGFRPDMQMSVTMMYTRSPSSTADFYTIREYGRKVLLIPPSLPVQLWVICLCVFSFKFAGSALYVYLDTRNKFGEESFELSYIDNCNYRVGHGYRVQYCLGCSIRWTMWGGWRRDGGQVLVMSITCGLVFIVTWKTLKKCMRLVFS